MKKIAGVILTVISVAILFTGISSAEEEVGRVKSAWRRFLTNLKKDTQEEKVEPKAAQTEPDLFPAEEEQEAPSVSSIATASPNEIAERIRRLLEITPEISENIPELNVITGEEGVVRVEYGSGGFYRNIATLDKNTLVDIYNRVNGERLKIQNERIHRQLTTLRPPQSVPKTPEAPPAVPSAVQTAPPSVPPPMPVVIPQTATPPQPPPSTPQTQMPPPTPPAAPKPPASPPPPPPQPPRR